MVDPRRIGVLLAGGRGERFGGVDKGALDLAGETLAARAAARLSPQVSAMVVAGSTRPDWCDEIGAAGFVEDVTADGRSLGPVGGVIGSLRFVLDQYGEDTDLLIAPIDCPLFPLDLGDQLLANRGSAPVAIPRHAGRLHPVFGLWRTECHAAVADLSMKKTVRALKRIVEMIGGVGIDVAASPTAFHNINTPEDLMRARELIETDGA